MIKRLQIKFVCIIMTMAMALLITLLVVVYHTTALDMEKSSIAALKVAAENNFVPGRPGTGGQPCFVLHEGVGSEILVSGSEYYDLSDEGMIRDIYLQAKQQRQDSGVLEDYALRYYRESARMGDRYAFTDISDEQATLQNLLTVCLVILVTGACAFLIVSILLARWATRPVEKAFLQQRQFVADASHELKTPLTVILTNAEMLQSPEYGDREKQKFGESILDVSRQMRGLVESLLQLARSDRGQQNQHMIRTDLSALVGNAVLPFEPVYFESGLALESNIAPGLWINGDPTALRQVVDILLDNGRKYSTPGGTAVMTLSRQGKRVQLRFFTPGTPLTDQQCKDIFKRFYRLDEARTAGGSYGLGLSIAHSIIQAHGGRIWAQGTMGGNLFIISVSEA